MDYDRLGIDKKVVDRIRKLLSMANSKVHLEENDNEHERDTAMRMALKLMAKHNLTMHDMSAQHGVKEEARISEQMQLRDEPWADYMVLAAAEMFFCFVYRSRVKKTYVFVGKESNVATAKEMAKFLVDSVAKASRRATSKSGGGSAFKTAFRKGASDRICQRTKQMIKEAQAEAEQERTPGTSIVLASLYAQELQQNQALIKSQGVDIKFTNSRERQVTDGEAYSQGHEFGKSVNFNKQVK